VEVTSLNFRFPWGQNFLKEKKLKIIFSLYPYQCHYNSSQGEKECPYYMRTGSCKYGANCKFNHPDPTAVAGGDPSSGFGNGGSVSLGASQSSATTWSPPRAMNENSPFVPVVLSPTPGVPPQNSDWNGYQVLHILSNFFMTLIWQLFFGFLLNIM